MRMGSFFWVRVGPAGLLLATATSSLSESKVKIDRSAYAAGARAGTPRPSPTTNLIWRHRRGKISP